MSVGYFGYYIWVMIPSLALAGIATWLTKSTFAKYSRKMASSQMTGAQAARHMLDSQGLRDVRIERAQGFLSDHYDPRHRVLRLSPPVYDVPSLSAIGVACHEAGHAMQHAEKYLPLALRSTLVPATNVASRMSYFLILGGFVLQAPFLVKAAVICFAMALVFAVITLPVEWDATARAKRQIVAAGIVTSAERADAAKVLNAAFLTYVASAITALLTFIYYFMRARD